MHISGTHSHQHPSHPRQHRIRSMNVSPRRIHQADTLSSSHTRRTSSRTQSSLMPPELPPATPPPAPAHPSRPSHPLSSARGRCSEAHAPRLHQTSPCCPPCWAARAPRQQYHFPCPPPRGFPTARVRCPRPLQALIHRLLSSPVR